jgi:hypothetical protein
MAQHPNPTPARGLFVRGDFGIDQNAVLAGQTIKEFVSVNNAWGCTMQLQWRDGEKWVSAPHPQTLTAAEVGGGWVETPQVAGTEERSYRLRLARGDQEWCGDERIIRHIDPADYTGLAQEAYELVKSIRPLTIIDVVNGPISSTMNPSTLAHAFQGYDRMELSDLLAKGGSARGDFRTVVLHELGHLIQWDAYQGHAVQMSDHLTAVFGPQLPLERSADCLMEFWGGLAEGNHFPYYEGEALECTKVLAAGQPYWAKTLGKPQAAPG